MKLRIPALVMLTLVATHCRKETTSLPVATRVVETASPSSAPIEVGEFSADSLQTYVGKLITVHGKFSLYGVVGPFIRNGDSTIHFKSSGNYSWGKEYDPMEGQEVTATGILQFRHFEPSAGQHPPDYYYFQAETTPIKLLK